MESVERDGAGYWVDQMIILEALFCTGKRVYNWPQLGAQLSALVRVHQLRKLKDQLKQQLRSWFGVNAIFPLNLQPTWPGFISGSQPHLDLIYSKVCSGTDRFSKVNLSCHD